MNRLNVGCGTDLLDGWTNADRDYISGVDTPVMFDLEQPGSFERWPNNHFDELRAEHVLEHVTNLLPLVQELWRVAKPDATFTIIVPYGWSDDAIEDPTHVRYFTPASFPYFGQPIWKRAAPYGGYRADWKTERVELVVDEAIMNALGRDHCMAMWRHETNIVRELRATMRAVKPARPTGEGPADQVRCDFVLTPFVGTAP